MLSDASGIRLAHGELIQWLEGDTVASQLIFHFEDGSFYDEVVRFSQQSVFRLLSYELTQRGPSFSDNAEVEFDRSGQYRARQQSGGDENAASAVGHVDVPDDVSNGMISILLKNLSPQGAATTRMLAFRPKPVTVEMHLAPEGTERYAVGPASGTATRFLIRPEIPGFKGALATVLGKQPPNFRMWIAQGAAPVLIHFEGPLYDGGPRWHIGLSAPRLDGNP